MPSLTFSPTEIKLRVGQQWVVGRVQGRNAIVEMLVLVLV